MKIKYILMLCLLALAACNDSAAMTACEKHSRHDECFYALNR